MLNEIKEKATPKTGRLKQEATRPVISNKKAVTKSKQTEVTVQQTDETQKPDNSINQAKQQKIEALKKEILIHKEDLEKSFYKMGQKLLELKDELESKEYKKWFSENVKLHKRTTDIYMQLVREYPNEKSISQIGVAKAQKLLAIEQPEREIFIKENSVEKMSVSKLQEKINEKLGKKPKPQKDKKKLDTTKYYTGIEHIDSCIDEMLLSLAELKDTDEYIELVQRLKNLCHDTLEKLDSKI